MRLKNNKTVVVVGGSGQMGQMTVKTLLSQGFKVINLDIENLKIKNKKYFFFQTNISNEKQVSGVALIIKKKFKKIYGLINHAHYKGKRILDKKSNFFKSTEVYPFSEWKNTLSVNLDGLFLTTKYFLPLLLKNKSSIIINTSSTYGKVSPNKNIYGKSGINSPISYSTTKFAIIGFTKYLATHFADKGLRANILVPGGILNKKHSKDFIKNYSNMTPMKRMSKTSDYASAILYLTSETSSYMNGAEFIIDGGWTSW